MKNTRKLTALFAILCLLATLWAPTTVAAATPETAPQAATAVTAADPLDAPLELGEKCSDETHGVSVVVYSGNSCVLEDLSRHR